MEVSVNKSIQELENKDYGNPDQPSSLLTTRCIQLTKTPINTFSIEDLRIMIGQSIGLTYLVPLAIKKLQENILAEGDFYPGDLLKSVISINNEFWFKHRELFSTLKRIIEENENEIIGAGISLDDFKSILL